jgi:uncharacterized membrane protein
MTEEHESEDGALGGMPKNRVEALVDGIFGVAMTLLVLDIKVPQGLALSSDAAIRSKLVDQVGNFRIYLISFIVLGMYWIAHHMQFHLVRSVDRVVLWINLMFMLGVSIVPFSTSLLGEYGESLTPALIYSFNLLWLAVISWVQIIYLEHHPHLASAALTPIAASRVKRRLLLFLGVPLLSMGVSLINTWLGVHLYFLMLLYTVLPGKIGKVSRTPVKQRSPPDKHST